METKAKILQQSERLFMRYGIRSVTMDDIARELGISKKTLYQHVDNKSDLIEQIFKHWSEEEQRDINQISQQAGNAIEEMIQIARYMIQRLRLLSPTMRYDLQKYYMSVHREIEQVHEEHSLQLITANIERGQQQGLYRPNIQPDVVAKLFMITATSVGNIEQFPLSQYDLDLLVRQLFLYHIHGIASSQGLQVLAEHLGSEAEEDL